jgi:hypothetical protein
MEGNRFFKWFRGKRVMACVQEDGERFLVGLAFRHECEDGPNPERARGVSFGRFLKKPLSVSRASVECDGLEQAVRGAVCDAMVPYHADEFTVEGLHRCAKDTRWPLWFQYECW